jgi:hypothetical protein
VSWENVHRTVKFMIPEIKEQMAVDDIGSKEHDHKIHFNFPPGADLQKVKNLDIDHQAEDLIVAKVSEKLKNKRALIVSMAEEDLLQLVGDSTAAAMCEIAAAIEKK